MFLKLVSCVSDEIVAKRRKGGRYLQAIPEVKQLGLLYRRQRRAGTARCSAVCAQSALLSCCGLTAVCSL